MKTYSIILFLIVFNINNVFTQNINSNFNITISDLEENLVVRDSFKNTIIKDSKRFLNLVNDILLGYPEQLTLVDKNNRITESDVPPNLVNLADYDLHTRYDTMLFVENAINDFVQMSNDAKSEGVDIFIASTYRDYAFQDQIFNNMIKYYGIEEAESTVAYPGASQHQTGTAVDFGSITEEYADTDAGIWLTKNAWKYGFSLSYPKGAEELTTYIWEPWHYRYIGKSAVIIQRDYFNDLQQLFLEFWDVNHTFFEDNYVGKESGIGIAKYR